MSEPKKHLDYRNFNVVGNDYVTEQDLYKNDYFMEDTFPEVYQVTGAEVVDGQRFVTANEVNCGEKTYWLNKSNLVMLTPKE